MKILYLHGLGSSGNSRTPKMLENEGYDVCSPTYEPHDYDSSKSLIESLSNKKFDLITGTSFGGYWATTLASLTHIPTLVFNPVIEPSFNLRKYIEIGGVTNYTNGTFIPLDREEISKFHNIDSKLLNKIKNPFSVICGSKDIMLPPKYVEKVCLENGIDFKLIEGMGHRVDERILPHIKSHLSID